ncbi:MFS transporter [Sulfitobacter albidus]|uniref:MFS transporter n=1 Tax=Sulfitobacter albidus TaxID=2829501 RepID=A0A975JBN7_9RHOB|nr:MFS transporter [Sulfitobacter albidus]QUJ75387.1 MFS transporter [Sulfitobacter albidus]
MSLIHDLSLSRKPLAGFVAIGLAWSAYFAQMPVIKAGVDASDGAYGVAVLWASFGAIAAMWLAPLAHARLGGAAVALSICVIALSILGTGLVGTLWALALMLLLLSAGSGVVDVLINAQVAQAEESSGRALMNLNHGLYSLSYAASAVGVGALREAGWAPPQIFALLLVLFAALGWASLGRTAAPDDVTPEAKTPLPTALIWIAGTVVFFGFLIEAASEGWSALHLERGLGGSAQQGALGPALLGLMMGVGRLSGHALARFVPELVLMSAACLLTAVGLIAAALAPTVGVALAGFATAGLGVSVIAPLTLAIAGRSAPAHIRLVVIARVSVLGYGAFFMGPPLMGLIAQGYSLSTAFLTVAVLSVGVGIGVVPLLARVAR